MDCIASRRLDSPTSITMLKNRKVNHAFHLEWEILLIYNGMLKLKSWTSQEGMASKNIPWISTCQMPIYLNFNSQWESLEKTIEYRLLRSDGLIFRLTI